MARKKQTHKFLANNTHIAALSFVGPTQPASLVNGLETYVIELRFRAIDVAVAAAVLAHQTEVSAVDDGRGIAHVGRTANVLIILVVEVVLAGRKLAGANRGHAAVVDLHVIFAEISQTLRGSGAKALSQPDQEQQRSDSPCNSKHGEKRA